MEPGKELIILATAEFSASLYGKNSPWKACPASKRASASSLFKSGGLK
jgi:hypothetical protein